MSARRHNENMPPDESLFLKFIKGNRSKVNEELVIDVIHRKEWEIFQFIFKNSRVDRFNHDNVFAAAALPKRTKYLKAVLSRGIFPNQQTLKTLARESQVGVMPFKKFQEFGVALNFLELAGMAVMGSGSRQEKKIAFFLRQSQFDVNETRLLERAIQYNQISSIKRLLEHKADPNKQGPSGCLPLIKSIKQPQAFSVLLDHGANLVVRDKRHQMTPLDVLKTQGLSSCPPALLKTLADRKIQVFTLDDAYKMLCDETTVALCRKSNMIRNTHIKKIMVLATQYVEQINAFFPVEDPQETLLTAAARHGFIELVVQLHGLGALPDKRCNLRHKTALHYAVREGNNDLAVQLLLIGADGNAVWESHPMKKRYPLDMAKDEQVRTTLKMGHAKKSASMRPFSPRKSK